MMLQPAFDPSDSFRMTFGKGDYFPEPSAPPAESEPEIVMEIDVKSFTREPLRSPKTLNTLEHDTSKQTTVNEQNQKEQNSPYEFSRSISIPYATAVIAFELSNDNIIEASEIDSTSFKPAGDSHHVRLPTSVRSAMPENVSTEALINLYKANFNFDVIQLCGNRVKSEISSEWRSKYYFSKQEIVDLMNKSMPLNTPEFVHLSNWREELKRARIKGASHRMDLVVKDFLHNGVMVPDAALHTVLDVYQFFEYHNRRPSIHVSIHYTLERENKEPRIVKRMIDITKFIFPFGKISYNGKRSVKKVIFDYLDSDNRLKSLRMMKRVNFDFKTLAILIKEYLMQCHHASKVKVSIKSRDVSVRIYADSLRSSIWESRLGRAISLVTIVGGVGLTLYGEIHRNRSLRSDFAILFSPLEIFDAIREDIV